ncbi:MAG: aminotransferase class I/II-fold pyridoxal phosphate-dependent enzyme [Actinomycetota bacterium]
MASPSASTTRRLARRPWVPADSEDLVDAITAELAPTEAPPGGVADLVESLIVENRRIHDIDGINLNPATNTLSPRALAALSGGLGSRTSLGYPGAKYEMGLEAIERIEVVAAELAGRLFGADHVEIRVPSGAMANLYGFLATTAPGDAVIVHPSSIGGHVTHHRAGAAGLVHLDLHEAPIDPARYTIDTDGLAELADRVTPSLITVGASLNLTHHDVPAIRAIADRHGARVLFDAAHLAGPIAGGAWPNPLAEGADLLTMSTYKSLAGPTAGMIMTNDAALAERIDRIAFPGLTANFDVSKTAALAITLGDWIDHGPAHAAAMVGGASHLAEALADRGVPVHRAEGRATWSHAFAIDARSFGGGSALARHLRRANLLTSAIGLPTGPDDGLRVGVNELVRIGAEPDHLDDVADLIAAATSAADPASVAPEAAALRQRLGTVRFAA